MKTNIKTSVLAIALMASVTGAFASEILNAVSNKKLVDYEWQQLDRNGNVIDNTTSTSNSNPYPTECNGNAEICAQGKVVGDSSYSIFYRYSGL